jgi:hypothetical protein
MATNIVAEQQVEVLSADTAIPNANVSEMQVEVLVDLVEIPNANISEMMVEVLALKVEPWVDRVGVPTNLNDDIVAAMLPPELAGVRDGHDGVNFTITDGGGEGEVPEGTATYPLLYALDSSEIPAKPTEPADTPLVSPTEITTIAQMQAVTGSGHYKLMNDLDFTGISQGDWTQQPFSGIFEGNNKTLSNVPFWMFTTITDGAEVRNLTFDGSNGDALTTNDTGALAKTIASTSGDIKISNVACNNVVFNGRYRCGALTGWVSSAGGNVHIWRCTADGGTIEQYLVRGEHHGGLIGRLSGSSGSINIVDCAVTNGYLSCKQWGGGFIGSIYPTGVTTNVHSCSVQGQIFRNQLHPAYGGMHDCGGFIGEAVDMNITSCTATVDWSDYVRVENISREGGFAGIIKDCIITDCTVALEQKSGTTIDQYYWSFGGFAGQVSSSSLYATTITGCSVTSVNGMEFNGYTYRPSGFVAAVGDTIETFKSKFDRCWTNLSFSLALGDSVTAAGGFAGEIMIGGADFVNCYTLSSYTIKSGSSETGGLYGGFVGDFSATANSDLQATNCYSAGNLSDFVTTGGFVGKNNNITYDANCTSCYWDEDTAGTSSDASTGAVGKSTMQMWTKETYVGWDFVDVWKDPFAYGVLLGWDRINDPYESTEVYKVWRSDDGGAFVNIGQSLPGQTAYSDVTTVAGVVYEYYVTAYRGDIPAETAASNTINLTLDSGIVRYELIRDKTTAPPSTGAYTIVSSTIPYTAIDSYYYDSTVDLKLVESTYYQVRGYNNEDAASSWSNTVTITVPVGPFDVSVHVGHTDITSI